MIPYQFRRTVENIVRAMVPWQDWTPTVDQAGAVAVTVSEAKYTLLGLAVRLYCRLAVTGAGTGNNVIIVAGIPTAIRLAYTGTDYCLGSAVILDSGIAYYHAGVVPQSATSVKFAADAQGNYVGAAPNFALANGDSISFTATYRIA